MKGKLNLLLALSLLFSIGAFAQNRSIKFEQGTWKEIKEKAVKENKLIFMDCYTSWCGPCKWMAKNTFTNDTVADYFNSKFINATFDMEKGEGIELAKTYSVRVYPSLFFIDGQGNIVHRSVGALASKELIQLGEDAQNPEKVYGTMVKKYENGNRDAAFIINYLEATSNAGLNTEELVKSYFSTQKEKDLITQPNFTIMYKYLTDINSREFKYLVANIDAFQQKYRDSVLGVENRVYTQSLRRVINGGDKKEYLELKEVIQKNGFNNEPLLLKIDLDYYKSQKDWKNYSSASVLLFEKYYHPSMVYMANDVCWTFFEEVSDQKMLAKALVWIQNANKAYPSPEAIDTEANLLFKTGNKNEAIKKQEEAIAMENKEVDKDESLIKNLEKTLQGFKK